MTTMAVLGIVFSLIGGLVTGHEMGVNSVVSSDKYCRTQTVQISDRDVEQCYEIRKIEPRIIK